MRVRRVRIGVADFIDEAGMADTLSRSMTIPSGGPYLVKQSQLVADLANQVQDDALPR